MYRIILKGNSDIQKWLRCNESGDKQISFEASAVTMVRVDGSNDRGAEICQAV